MQAAELNYTGRQVLVRVSLRSWGKQWTMRQWMLTSCQSLCWKCIRNVERSYKLHLLLQYMHLIWTCCQNQLLDCMYLISRYYSTSTFIPHSFFFFIHDSCQKKKCSRSSHHCAADHFPTTAWPTTQTYRHKFTAGIYTPSKKSYA